MNTLDEYLNATPTDRERMLAKLPAHRGTPKPWNIAGHIAEMKRQAGRTPTHRAETK